MDNSSILRAFRFTVDGVDSARLKRFETSFDSEGDLQAELTFWAFVDTDLTSSPVSVGDLAVVFTDKTSKRIMTYSLTYKEQMLLPFTRLDTTDSDALYQVVYLKKMTLKKI